MSSVEFICVFFVSLAILQLVISQGPYKRVCYYTNWAQYRSRDGKYYPEDIDPNICTHLVYAFAKLKGNQLEAFEWNDESTDWMRGMYARFNDIKRKNPTIKTLLAVGGWNMASKPFTAMVATPASRREFATSSVIFLRGRNFNGLDLDWEYPANRGSPPEDREKYTQLVAEIRHTFDEEARKTGREPLLLTSAVAAGKDKIDTAYDVPQLCRDMDFISVMTYDLHGSWEDVTGHNSPLFAHAGEAGTQRFLNMDWAANYWHQMGCPKEKIVIGMGLYGRTFTLTDPTDNGLMASVRGKGEEGKFTREGGFLSYYEICEMIQSGAQAFYIKDQEAPYLVKGNQWVGYDDADSLRIKVRWTKNNGFAGVMMWALDLDDFNNRCGYGRYPLLKAINQELEGVIATPPKTRQNRIQPSQSEIQRVNVSNLNHEGRQRIPTSTPTAAPHLTSEYECPPGENSYFASPVSCEDYFICAGGISFKFKCTSPLRWNSLNNFCDWPENVRCEKKTKPTQPKKLPDTQRTVTPPKRTTTTTRTTVTIAQTSPSTIPPTPSWLDWTAWISEFWKALTSMAGSSVPWSNQVLSGPPPFLQQPPFQQKQPPLQQPTTKPKSFCYGKKDGIHPDPKDCVKYIDCASGREYPSSCPTGTAFDPMQGVCDFTHKVTRCANQGFK